MANPEVSTAEEENSADASQSPELQADSPATNDDEAERKGPSLVGISIIAVIVAALFTVGGWVYLESNPPEPPEMVVPDFLKEEPRADISGVEMPTEIRNLLTNWLVDRGHSNIVDDEHGVRLESNYPRFFAMVSEVPNQNDSPIRWRISFFFNTSASTFFAYNAITDEIDRMAAITEAFDDYSRYALPALYDSYLSPNGKPSEYTVDINGQTHEVVFGELYFSGHPDEPKAEIIELRQAICDELELVDFDELPVALNISYSQGLGKARPVHCQITPTLDESLQKRIERKLDGLDWPMGRKSFYYIEQYIIIK